MRNYVSLVASWLWRHPRRALVWGAVLGLLAWGARAGACYAWATVHYRAAQDALARREPEEALKHLRFCMQVWGSRADVHFLAARAARRAGDFDEAQAQLRECQRLQGGGTKATALESALLQAQAGNVREVEGDLQTLVERNHPDSVLILEALAQGYVSSYQLGLARRCLDELLQRDPDHDRALMLRGWILQGMGDRHGAIESYRRVVELKPTNDQARLNWAEGLRSVQRVAEARKQFEYLRQRQPHHPRVVLGLARCLRDQGEGDEARRLLDSALEEGIETDELLTERGQLAKDDGDLPGAERWLRRAVKLAPNGYEARYQLLLCLEAQGKKEEAAKEREALKGMKVVSDRMSMLIQKVTSAADNPEPRYELGVLWFGIGEDSEGVRWLASALQVAPSYAPAHRALAEYYERQGRKELAERHRRQAEEAP
jgi:tetratricopeptide (TPR) repeat protein